MRDFRFILMVLAVGVSSGCQESSVTVTEAPPADSHVVGATVRDNHCVIHHVPLEHGSVPIMYGLPNFAYFDERDRMFPNSNSVVLGGCVRTRDSTRFAWVEYCPVCRKSEEDWDAQMRQRAYVDFKRRVMSALDGNNEKDVGSTSLRTAVQRGYLDIVETLLDRGALVDTPDGFGQTPLHYAAMSGEVNIAKALLERRASVNARSHQQMTPLHFAAMKSPKAMAQLLVRYGADSQAKDSSDCTPADLAGVNFDHPDVESYLRALNNK